MDNLLLFVYIVGDPEGFDFGIRNGECGMKKRKKVRGCEGVRVTAKEDGRWKMDEKKTNSI
jgi:hypothetical protein